MWHHNIIVFVEPFTYERVVGAGYGGHMFKSITANAITAVATAALAATSTIFLTPGVVPEAKAHSQVSIMLPPLALADAVRAIAKLTACPPRGWPYYEQSCL